MEGSITVTNPYRLNCAQRATVCCTSLTISMRRFQRRKSVPSKIIRLRRIPHRPYSQPTVKRHCDEFRAQTQGWGLGRFMTDAKADFIAAY